MTIPIDCLGKADNPVTSPLRRASIQQGQAQLDRPRGTATVVLADQAVLIHIALRALLTPCARYSVVAAARTVLDAEQLVRRVRPRLLICEADIGGQSGLRLCRYARQISPATRAVILTDRNEPLLARLAMSAGAAGYLLKDTAPEVLTASLDSVLAGTAVIDARLGSLRAPSPGIGPLADAGFSRREREVLAELVGGLDNKTIAERLCISEETVKCHVKAIFRKLGARDRAHAVAVAVGTATVVTK